MADLCHRRCGTHRRRTGRRLAEIATDTLRHDFRSIHPEESRIVLLEGSPHVLPAYPEDLSMAAERQLIRLGVQPRTNVRVTGIDGESVALKTAAGSERIETRTVLWAAGVAASEFGKVLETSRRSAHRSSGPRAGRAGSDGPRPSRNLRHRRPWPISSRTASRPRSRSGRDAAGPLRRPRDSRTPARPRAWTVSLSR